MSYFKAKMHQIRFRLGLRPKPRRGSLQRSPDPLAGFKGPTSRGSMGAEGKVRLWRRCASLCTSGLMNDVMFAHNGQR